MITRDDILEILKSVEGTHRIEHNEIADKILLRQNINEEDVPGDRTIFMDMSSGDTGGWSVDFEWDWDKED